MCLKSFLVHIMAIPDVLTQILEKAAPLAEKFYYGLRNIMVDKKDYFLNLQTDIHFPRMLRDMDMLTTLEMRDIRTKDLAVRQSIIFDKLLKRLRCDNLQNFLKVLSGYDPKFTLLISSEIQTLKEECDLSKWFCARAMQIVVKHWYLLCEYNTCAFSDPALDCLLRNHLLTSKEHSDIAGLAFDESYYLPPLISGLSRRTDMMLRTVYYKLTDVEKWNAFIRCVEDDMKLPLVQESMVSMLII